ncbi:MAG: aminopeptidase P family N-terminal domain-containing protein, partial [Thermomicrobiaceae bacterium]|nr:aminopeptidase P family N-terminal domain-containing protein [Thermomicrobiaceae bacterium]
MRDPSQCLRGRYVDLERLRRHVDAGPYDAVIAMSPENVPYYSGFYNVDLRVLPERFHFVVWPRGGEPAFVVVERRAESLRPEETFLTDLVGYQGEGLDAMRAVAEVLASRGVPAGRVGIEGRHFPGGYLQDLQRRLPGVQFEDAEAFLERPRLIKTPAEVEALARVNRDTAAAIEAAFLGARPGETEREVAARMQYELLRRGADVVVAP